MSIIGVACLLLFTISLLSGCGALQATGVLNDRADDYKSAKSYPNQLVDSPVWQFTDGYPIPAKPIHQGPDSLLRPKLGFIPQDMQAPYLRAYTARADSVIIGTDVLGRMAILLRFPDQSDAHSLLHLVLGNYATIVKDYRDKAPNTPFGGSASSWRGQFDGKTISITTTKFVTSLMLTITHDQQNEQAVPTNSTVTRFAEKLLRDFQQQITQ